MRYLTLAHVLEITLVSACTGGLVMFAWELVKVFSHSLNLLAAEVD